MPVLLGGQGISHVGWDTGDLPSQGEKSTGVEPHPAPRRSACGLSVPCAHPLRWHAPWSRDFPGHTLARSLEQGLFRRVPNLAKPWSRSAAVLRHACVACRGPLDLELSHSSKGTRSLWGGPQVCREKVVCACTQHQGMFLLFETRRSGVGECARRVLNSKP